MPMSRSNSASEVTGKNTQYGKQSGRQLCLPVEDKRRIHSMTKQNSFHKHQASVCEGPPLGTGRCKLVPTLRVYQAEMECAESKPSLVSSHILNASPQAGVSDPQMGGSGSQMVSSWTSGDDGSGTSSDDITAWRKFRNSDRLIKNNPRLSFAKFASSIELSIDNGEKAKDDNPGITITSLSSCPESRYFYPKEVPGTKVESDRIFNDRTWGVSSSLRTEPFAREKIEKIAHQNGISQSGFSESLTTGSFPELHSVAGNENRRGSFPVSRKMGQSSPMMMRNIIHHDNDVFKNSQKSWNAFQDYQNSSIQQGIDLRSFKDANENLRQNINSSNTWNSQKGSVCRRDRHNDIKTKENIYEEIDSSSLKYARGCTSSKLLKPPPTPPLDAHAGGFRGPILSLRLPSDHLSQCSLFNSPRTIHQSFDDVIGAFISQEYPSQNRGIPAPVIQSNSDAHGPRPNSGHLCNSHSEDSGVPKCSGRNSRNAKSPIQAPSAVGVSSDGYLEPVTLSQPVDTTVARLEAILLEKDGERKRLQAAMAEKENALIKQLRLEKHNCEMKLVEQSDEWNRRLLCHQQKAFRTEQHLLSQICNLEAEIKFKTEQLEKKCLEYEILEKRVTSLEDEFRTSIENEARLQTLVNYKEEELGSLRDQMKTVLPLFNISMDNGGAKTETPNQKACSNVETKGRILASDDKEIDESQRREFGLHEATINDSFVTKDEDATPRSVTSSSSNSASEDVTLVQKLQMELEQTQGRLRTIEEQMRLDQEQWLNEKQKVIAYQKQLQLNYIQMLHRNRTLQQEANQLTLELERHHIRQTVEVSATLAPLANNVVAAFAVSPDELTNPKE